MPARPRSPVLEYIAGCPAAVRPRLRELRRLIRAAAPQAEEIISYRMPAYRQGRILVYFAAFKAHIGLFPPVGGNAKLERALARFAGPKGNLRIPHDEPLPVKALSELIRWRVHRLQSRK